MDYDGTLAGIKKIPSAAAPTPDILKALTRLASNEANIVYVISGRDQPTLQSWLGSVPRLGLSAEHGCLWRTVPKQNDEKTESVDEEWMLHPACADDSWKESILAVLEHFAERTPGSFIEQKRTSLAWHYRMVDPDFGYLLHS